MKVRSVTKGHETVDIPYEDMNKSFLKYIIDNFKDNYPIQDLKYLLICSDEKEFIEMRYLLKELQEEHRSLDIYGQNDNIDLNKVMFTQVYWSCAGHIKVVYEKDIESIKSPFEEYYK